MQIKREAMGKKLVLRKQSGKNYKNKYINYQ